MISLRLSVPLLTLAALLVTQAAYAAEYALCIHESPARIAARTDPQAAPAYWGAFAAFGEELKAAGVLRSGSAFDTGTPVKTVKPGQAATAPTAAVVVPTAPVFGGYFVIDVASEAEALAWAARAPNVGGHINVHALLPMMAK